jgi:hypothetical protein
MPARPTFTHMFMNQAMFNNLSLESKAEFIQKQGNFIEGQDYYSYRILWYTLDNHYVELLYDFTDRIVKVEFMEARRDGTYTVKPDDAGMPHPSH